MAIGSINNQVNFKGAMVVKGDPKDVTRVVSFFKHSTDGLSAINEQKYTLPLSGVRHKNVDSMLFTTGNDTVKKEVLFNDAVRSYKGFQKFCNENLGKYFDGLHTYDAKEVLTAVKTGAMDFVNMVIKH